MMMVTKRSLKPAAAEAEPNPVQGRILEAAFSAFMEYGFAETSTLEIATRAKVSKRELYALFGSKQDMLIACIRARTKRFQMPTELPEPRDREMLVHVLTAFGKQLLRETTDPAVIAAFRLAIAEALRTPEVARELNASGIQANRAALREIMARACAAGLLSGKPAEIAEQFAGLLWGNQVTSLLLGIAERPSPREITRRAEAATAALLRLYAADKANGSA
jgi:AcrR family transcriptional regulator